MIDFLARPLGYIFCESLVTDLRPVPIFKKIINFRSNPDKPYMKPLFNDIDMWHQKNTDDTILVSYDNN